MSKHTPTPWSSRPCLCGHAACSSKLLVGPHCTDSRFSSEDADFIVRACNSYDSHIEALEAALVCLEDPHCGRLKALNLVRAALAKASEEKAG